MRTRTSMYSLGLKPSLSSTHISSCGTPSSATPDSVLRSFAGSATTTLTFHLPHLLPLLLLHLLHLLLRHILLAPLHHLVHLLHLPSPSVLHNPRHCSRSHLQLQRQRQLLPHLPPPVALVRRGPRAGASTDAELAPLLLLSRQALRVTTTLVHRSLPSHRISTSQ